MKLLVELADPKSLQFIKEDEDIGGVKKKTYFLKGPMIGADVVNRNGRTYPKTIIEREVNKFQQMIKEHDACGTLNHDDTPEINLEKISHKIIKLEMVGNEAIGTAKVLNTRCGLELQALIEGEIRLGMSTRGVGSLSEDQTVKEDFSLLSIDVVKSPSYQNAQMTAESIEESVDWALNGDKWVKVCKDGKCKLVKTTSINESTVNIMGYDWDVEVIDSTHIKYKIVGSDKWAIPQHIGQLSDEMKDKLEQSGVIKNGSFVTVGSTPTKTESVVETAVKTLREDVDHNASSKYYLDYMTKFIDTINTKTR